jgi:hypothetical protein
LATYIVNVYKKEVHVSENATANCNISRMRDNHRIDTNDDYSDGYSSFKPCPYCYIKSVVTVQS